MEKGVKPLTPLHALLSSTHNIPGKGTKPVLIVHVCVCLRLNFRVAVAYVERLGHHGTPVHIRRVHGRFKLVDL